MSIKHALVVDDSKSARFSLRKLLQQAGLSVDMVDSGEAALEYLRAQRPDVVFMDHMMPGLDGLQAAKAIKENPSTTMIPIIMSTSKEGDDYIKEVKAHGAVNVLPKPSSPDVLAEVLGNLDVSLQAQKSAEEPVAVESMAEDRVAVVVQLEVEKQLTYALAAQFDQLKQELLADTQKVAKEVSKGLGQASVHEFQREWVDSVQEQLESRAATISQEIAQEVFTDRAQELVSQFNNTINDRLAKLKAESTATRALDSMTREEIRSIAHSVADQHAVEVARQTAQSVTKEVASQLAQKVAKQTAETTTNALLNEALQTNRPSMGPVYLLSSLAVVTSILAVIAVYFVHY